MVHALTLILLLNACTLTVFVFILKDKSIMVVVVVLVINFQPKYLLRCGDALHGYALSSADLFFFLAKPLSLIHTKSHTRARDIRKNCFVNTMVLLSFRFSTFQA